MAAIFGRFSQNCETLLTEAQNIAHQLKRPIRSDIVVLAILNQSETIASSLLKGTGLVQPSLVEYVTASDGTTKNGLAPSLEMQTLLEESIKLAGRFRFSSVEVEHVLYVIAKDARLAGNFALKESGVDPKVLTTRLTEWLFSVAMINQQPGQGEMTEGKPERERIDIERFTFDVTDAAEKRELDPVIGREKELEQLIHILLRRRKNNPLLLGEPGVGKTALVDALAERIARKAVPKALANKRILTLDLGLVVAGTMYRGQFEERLKGIIQEIGLMGDCILFIDEIHTLSGTGSAEGGFDAANILKPSLARGELTVIGATTHEEYRKHILKDKALDRRFQTLTIEEPSQKEAVSMLKGVKRHLELHHNVLITDAAIHTAVELSERYIHDRFLPDKALDILDQAATYHAEEYVVDTKLTELKNEIGLVASQKSEAAMQGEYDIAKEYMEKENQLLELLRTSEKKNYKKALAKPITEHHVAMVVSKRTGIPMEEILQTMEPVNLRRVKSILSKHVLGQDAAITSIAQSLLRGQIGLQPDNKPIGSFLLVGPTGVGKTETARVLAKEVFGDAKALIKIDMSEYMERHTVSNLIGAPAGYVGFEQGGSLTEQVRRRPYSVVLFDEVEKAHPDIFNLLLQILEDGYLTDNTGTTVSFKHTLIVMTSNLGMESFNQVARIGFSAEEEGGEQAAERKQDELKDHIKGEIDDFFRPELLGRITGILFYNPLDKPVVRKLLERRFKELSKRLKAKKLSVTMQPEAFDWLVEHYDPEAGARSIERSFLQLVEPAIIDALPETRPASLVIKVKGSKLTAETTQGA